VREQPQQDLDMETSFKAAESVEKKDWEDEGDDESGCLR
jgi:hypothetical protein